MVKRLLILTLMLTPSLAISAETIVSGTSRGDGGVEAGAYNATTWNNNPAAGSKDAIRDKIEAMTLGAGATIDDTAGNGDAGVVWSADKTYDEIQDAAGEAGAEIDDTAGDGDDTVVWSADKTYDEVAAKEDALGNPLTDGEVLGSYANGTRAWITRSLPETGVYGTAWGSDDINAATRKQIYDKIQSMSLAAGATIDDTAGDGDDALVWSADKTYDEIQAAGGTPATADISDVSVTQTELAELETIGATTLSAAQWTGLGGATTAGMSLWDDASTTAMRATLGLVIGTDVAAQSSLHDAATETGAGIVITGQDFALHSRLEGIADGTGYGELITENADEADEVPSGLQLVTGLALVDTSDKIVDIINTNPDSVIAEVGNAATLETHAASYFQTALTNPVVQANFGTGAYAAVGNTVNATGGLLTHGNAAILSGVLTGYTSGAGTVAATDTILEAFQKINGNIAGLGGGHDAVTIGTANGLSLSTQALSLAAATNSTPGAMTAAQVTALETVDTEDEVEALIFDVDNTGNMLTTGTISGAMEVDLDTAATVDLSTSADALGGFRINNDDDVIDYTLPPAVVGLTKCFYSRYAAVITIDVDDTADTIILDGVANTAGHAIDSPGTVGDFICLAAIDSTYWITLGRSGTWVAGGAD